MLGTVQIIFVTNLATNYTAKRSLQHMSIWAEIKHVWVKKKKNVKWGFSRGLTSEALSTANALQRLLSTTTSAPPLQTN